MDAQSQHKLDFDDDQLWRQMVSDDFNWNPPLVFEYGEHQIESDPVTNSNFIYQLGSRELVLSYGPPRCLIHRHDFRRRAVISNVNECLILGYSPIGEMPLFYEARAGGLAFWFFRERIPIHDIAPLVYPFESEIKLTVFVISIEQMNHASGSVSVHGGLEPVDFQKIPSRYRADMRLIKHCGYQHLGDDTFYVFVGVFDADRDQAPVSVVIPHTALRGDFTTRWWLEDQFEPAVSIRGIVQFQGEFSA
ncbi:MAG: hypothetical protein ACKV2Q_12175 [Planctomycetaceae bacterium]